jgi:hypothetical protein
MIVEEEHKTVPVHTLVVHTNLLLRDKIALHILQQQEQSIEQVPEVGKIVEMSVDMKQEQQVLHKTALVVHKTVVVEELHKIVVEGLHKLVVGAAHKLVVVDHKKQAAHTAVVEVVRIAVVVVVLHKIVVGVRNFVAGAAHTVVEVVHKPVAGVVVAHKIPQMIRLLQQILHNHTVQRQQWPRDQRRRRTFRSWFSSV